MPWKEMSVMEQREMLIRAWLTKRYSKTELCKQFGISRPTADKWIRRHFEHGLDGLQDQSRRPHSSPNATAPHICAQLIAAKREKPHWGAKKLLGLLRMRHPETHWPSNSTGELILKRAGLVEPRRKRKRMSADSNPLSDSDAPNQIWCIDFKGDFLLGNQCRCYPLTVSDHYSRKLLLCHALGSTVGRDVLLVLTQLFKDNGLPYRMRSDNGTPFASQALGGLSRVSKWLVDHDVMLERINPGHPEQNGRHERMHRSLKEYLEKHQRIESDLAGQQHWFDEFVWEYNEERIHERLNNLTPAQVYRPSEREFNEQIVPYDYGDVGIVRSVRSNGEIKWRGRLFYVSEILAGEKIVLIPYGDGLWEMYYRFHPLGQMNDHLKKIERYTEWRKIKPSGT